MSITCDTCRGSGVPYWSAMGTDSCQCPIGRAEQNEPPTWPDPVLEAVAIRNRDARMTAEGRDLCWHCDCWKPRAEIINATCADCRAKIEG